MRNRFGFTLAEVLITLGVLGLIATFTLPTLIENGTERARVAALKKVYSTLSNAYKLAEQEYGTPDTWGMIDGMGGDAKPAINNLKPHLKISKECIDGSKGCFPAGVGYSYLSSPDGVDIYDNYWMPKVILADGTLIAASVYHSTPNIGDSLPLQGNNVYGSYTVDINGFKGPNQWGKDTFRFYLTIYGIVPVGTQQEKQPNGMTFANTCKDSSTAMGWGCAAWVIYNENEDYIHCNNLDWNGPLKCN